MKPILVLSLTSLFALAALLPSPAVAAEAPAAVAKADFSTPVGTTKAFFAAIKARDFATVEKALAPKMRDRIAKKGITTERFSIELLAEIGSVVSIADEPSQIAETQAKVPVTFNDPKKGFQVEGINLIKVGAEWQIEAF